MLTEIVPAYLYRQYANDDDLPAFVDAFNAAAQYYLDWFTKVNLAYYPGLSGPLLDWIANGVYGIQRTSLASPTTPAQGPLNTLELNTKPFNYYFPPQTSSYVLTDDAFQRIITWNFYKGDGKRFNMRWLKRRIMRFLLGANGIDPQPGTPGFVIGCENTQPVSVVVADNVITASIDQVLLSSLVQITPGILQILQLAFEAGQSGPLELPAQYETYQFNIVTSLTVTASPTTLSSAGAATTQTTGAVTFAVLGGSGEYTYAGSFLAGSAPELSAATPDTNETTMTGAGMTGGNLYNGTYRMVVTDTITTDTAMVDVPVSMNCIAAPTASVAPTTLSVTGASGTLTTPTCTVTVETGSGSYTISWEMEGASGIEPTAPSSFTTAFQATGLAPGEDLSDTGKATITDTVTGLETTVTVPVAIDRVTLVSVSVSPDSASTTGTGTTQTTNAVTATPSGGEGPYTIVWEIVSGPFTLVSSSASATNSFQCAGMTPGNEYTGTARVHATDQLGQSSSYADVPLSATCTNPQYVGSLLAGDTTIGYDTIIGYYPAYSVGSLAPSTDYYGKSFVGVAYTAGPGGAGFSVEIYGFSSDPGKSYFNNIVAGSSTYDTATATYSYASGYATWTWGGSSPFGAGETYPITINYEP